MKINQYSLKELIAVISSWMVRYLKVVPDSSIKKQNITQFVEGLAELILDKLTGLQYTDQETLTEALNKGLAGDYNDSIRFLTAPTIIKWIKTLDDEKKKNFFANQYREYELKKEEEMKNVPAIFERQGMPAHCAFVIYARLNQMEKFYEYHKIEDIRADKLQWVIDNLYTEPGDSLAIEYKAIGETVEKVNGRFRKHLIDLKNQIWKIKEGVMT